MKKLKKAERPRVLHIGFYKKEWDAIAAEQKGTKDDYSEIVRRAVRAFFALN